MSIQINTPAGKIIEEQLDSHLAEIQKQFSADALTFFGPLFYGAEGSIRDAVESIFNSQKGIKKTAGKKRPKLCVILETPGGYAEVAERIAGTLHKHFESVEFIVPDFAMSAGTILVISGDEIWMDYFSVLGPIDPQVEGPKGIRIPAHGYIIKYKELISKSRSGKITTAELQFLLEKFDPAELYRYEQEMELSVTLLKDWLVKYKFRNWDTTENRRRKVTISMKRKCAQFVGDQLNNTKLWHSHNRGISMEILRRDVKLKIRDFGEDESINKCVRGYHKLLTDYMAKLGTDSAVHVVGDFSPMRSSR